LWCSTPQLREESRGAPAARRAVRSVVDDWLEDMAPLFEPSNGVDALLAAAETAA
jgi:hypothetical protein